MNMSHICLKISVAVGMLPLVALAALAAFCCCEYPATELAAPITPEIILTGSHTAKFNKGQVVRTMLEFT